MLFFKGNELFVIQDPSNKNENCYTFKNLCSLHLGPNELMENFLDTARHIDGRCNSREHSECSKDLEETRGQKKYSRGVIAMVRAGGHIDTWMPLYR